AVGRNADLNKAMEEAAMGMINLLVEKRKVTRLDAYGLTSVAGDCRIGRPKDNEKSVHCLVPKSVWHAAKGCLMFASAAARASGAPCLRARHCALGVLAILLAFAAPAVAQEKLRIVTTTTDLKSLTEAVGGDRVEVMSLVPPNLDPEEYQAKPQDVVRL